MRLTLGLTGMDPNTESALQAAIQAANSRMGNAWSLVPDADAEYVIVDMDSMYGPMSWQDATCLYVRGAVAWTLGDPCLSVHGGTCRETGLRSVLQLHPIVAARSHVRGHALDPTPALTNTALFARDQQLCLYCGREYPRQQLTRDHVLPLSRGGRDTWENVVAACFHCNSRKGGRTPQQASMPLLAVPYRPSWIEHLILSNRNILADQMAFLKNHLPRNARQLAA